MKLASLGITCVLILPLLFACDSKRSATTGPLPGEAVTGEPVTTATGLKYYDITVGTGEQPKGGGSQVTFHYTGRLMSGKLVDSTHTRGPPQHARLDKAGIPGLIEGLSSMKVAGKRKLVIPPNLAYGAQGMDPVVPRNATLVYDVELLEVKD